MCAALSLSNVTYQHLLLLVGIDILIYRIATIDPLDLWVIKNRLLARLTEKATQLNILRHQRAFLAPLPGSVALLVSEAGKETFILVVYFQSLWTLLLLVRCW